MTPPNPSSAAREAADKISANDDLVRGGWMPIGKFKAAEIIQAAIDNALSAERERRVAAERVIDAVGMQDIKSPEYILRQAEAYRAKFLKGDDHG